MCKSKKVADRDNRVIEFSHELPGELGEFNSPRPFYPSKGNGTYVLEYLTCDCTFKVVEIDGEVYDFEVLDLED